MKLSNHQWEFLKDAACLIDYAESKGFKLTGGELKRPPEMQKIYFDTGKSKTLKGQHPKSLAIDLNVFKDGKLTYEFEDIKPLGEYWESLSPHNVWGGFWKFRDCPHYQRSTNPRKSRITA